MDEQEGKIPDDDALFAKLMKRLTGRQIIMPDAAGQKVIRPDTESKSIVEVTEELMRRLNK